MICAGHGDSSFQVAFFTTSTPLFHPSVFLKNALYPTVCGVPIGLPKPNFQGGGADNIEWIWGLERL